MVKVTDYQIVQRDENDQAQVCFTGKLPADAPEGAAVYGRVFREEDHLPITPFQKCNVNDGEWKIEMTIPAGGLYSFEARMPANDQECLRYSGRIKLVRHFGVGDLYLLTGQSNMAGYGRDAAWDPPTLGVHLYANNGKWDVASHPLNDSIDTIYPENREDASATSPALSFGRLLKEKLNIPIGLVQASLGGSALSAWHPEEEGFLYRGMMRRIDVVGSVKGVLWYQGCTDAAENTCDTYYNRFRRMVELWREQLGDVPFVTVQLNRWTQHGMPDAKVDRYWGKIRDAQRRIAEDVPGVCIVPTTDLSMSDGIHNNSGSNVIIGYRMAMAAMKFVYKMPGQAAPAMRACKYVDETHLVLQFDPDIEMYDMDDTAYGLDVEDETGLIPCKKAIAEQNIIQIETERAYHLPAKFHAYWRCSLPSFLIKDFTGMPMLSCYDVAIERD